MRHVVIRRRIPLLVVHAVQDAGDRIAARTQVDVDGVVRSVINLSSYNYLGLATHPATIAAAQSTQRKFGVPASVSISYSTREP